MSDQLKGRRIAFLVELVEELAEGVHEGQRPEAGRARLSEERS